MSLHQEELFFEDGVRRLWDSGFKNIYIIQTCNPTFGIYEGPYKKFWKALHFPYSWQQAMADFQTLLQEEKTEYQYILLLDFDLFLADTLQITRMLEEIEEGRYDRVSHFRTRQVEPLVTGVDWQRDWDFNNKWVVPAPPVKILSEEEIPKLEPFFVAGTFEFSSRKAWESYSQEDFRHDEKMALTFLKKGLKMGVTHTNYGTEGRGERVWTRDYFHVSNLTAFYQIIEWMDAPRLRDLVFNHGKEHSLFRLGHFVKQEQIYGDIYPLDMAHRLDDLCDIMGSRTRCLEVWEKWVQGTCMEKWEKYV